MDQQSVGETSLLVPNQFSKPSLPSAVKLLKDAVRFYRVHWHLLVGINIIPLAAFIPSLVMGEGNPLLAIILGMILVVLMIVSQVALMWAIIHIEESRGIEQAYRHGSRLFPSFLWLILLQSVAMMGGFLLLIIPGIILYIRLAFSSFALVAGDKRGIAAMIVSWHLVRGYWGSIAWRIAVFGGIILLLHIVFAILIDGISVLNVYQPTSLAVDMIDFLVTYLISLPMSTIYLYGLYQVLAAVKPAIIPPEEERSMRKEILFFIIIGPVVFVLGLIIVLSLFVTVPPVYEVPPTGGMLVRFVLSPLVSSQNGFASIISTLPGMMR